MTASTTTTAMRSLVEQLAPVDGHERTALADTLALMIKSVLRRDRDAA